MGKQNKYSKHICPRCGEKKFVLQKDESNAFCDSYICDGCSTEFDIYPDGTVVYSDGIGREYVSTKESSLFIRDGGGADLGHFDDENYICPECGKILEPSQYGSTADEPFVTDYYCTCGLMLSIFIDGGADYLDNRGYWHRNLEREDFLVKKSDEKEKGDDKVQYVGPTTACRFCGAVGAKNLTTITVTRPGNRENLGFPEKHYYCENCMETLDFFLGNTTK